MLAFRPTGIAGAVEEALDNACASADTGFVGGNVFLWVHGDSTGNADHLIYF